MFLLSFPLSLDSSFPTKKKKTHKNYHLNLQTLDSVLEKNTS